MRPEIENLHAILRWAAEAGAPDSMLQAASRELVSLIDRPEPDQRRVATFTLGRDIDRLRAQGISRAVICARLGISVHQYHRASTELRESRYPSAVYRALPHSEKEPV